MATFLLTWNPHKWHWPEDDLGASIAAVQRTGRSAGRWSCGNTKRILSGDRVFLLRQGAEPRGLVASGWATSEPYADRHWEDGGPLGRSTQYIDVDWDWLAKTPIISRAQLDAPEFAGVNWNTQTSGISVAAEVAHVLEREWGARVGSRYEPPPEEVVDPDYWEGAVASIIINAFERNAAARAKCIEHHGHACVVCGFAFEDHYGLAGKGLIHVHHLVPISDLGKSYQVDPIKDLRPVCPNCHAMIHRREPPYDIEDVKEMLTSVPTGAS